MEKAHVSIFFSFFGVWGLDLSVGCLELSVGCLGLSSGRLDLSSGCLDLSFGCLDLSSGCLDLSFGCLDLSFGCLWGSNWSATPAGQVVILLLVRFLVQAPLQQQLEM